MFSAKRFKEELNIFTNFSYRDTLVSLYTCKVIALSSFKQREIVSFFLIPAKTPKTTVHAVGITTNYQKHDQ